MWNRSLALASRFFRSQKAVAAVEFALIFPVMATMMLGTIEISHYLLYLKRVNNLAGNVGLLVSQSKTFTPNDAHFVWDAAIALFPEVLDQANSRGMAWWDVVNPSISSVVFRQKAACAGSCGYDAYVSWTVGRPNRACGKLTPTATGAGSSLTGLPEALYGTSSVIAVTTQVNYQPLISNPFTSTITLSATSYNVPRYLPEVPYSAPPGSDAGLGTVCTVP